ncbi:DUF805 domain-containing protein [Edwardsiella tarda]|uniref:DUF805 domain-containing protein n=1 Tax=Edwardsiella tarda TaxID=636 RepID=UPI003F65747C
MLIPKLAVSVRRLHDTGRSGWWCLITLIPLIGSNNVQVDDPLMGSHGFINGRSHFAYSVL